MPKLCCIRLASVFSFFVPFLGARMAHGARMGLAHLIVRTRRDARERALARRLYFSQRETLSLSRETARERDT